METISRQWPRCLGASVPRDGRAFAAEPLEDGDEEDIPQGNLSQSGLPYRANFTKLHFRQAVAPCHLRTC